jgi:hypothetical protein
MRILTTACLALLVCVLPLHAAKTIYVATNGNDNTGDGTSSKPFWSLQKAVNALTDGAGDDIVVRSGTYNWAAGIVVNRGGSSSNRTEIRAESASNKPIFDFNGYSTNINSESPGIYISDTYVTLRNITVRNNWKGVGIEGGASHVTIDGCVAYNCGRNGIVIRHPNWISRNDRLQSPVISNSTVYNCVLLNDPANPHYASRPWTTSGGWPFALGISTSNVAYENYGEGVLMYRCVGSSVVVRGNYARDNFSVNIYIDNVQGTSSSWARVENNETDCYNIQRLYRNGFKAHGIIVAEESYIYNQTDLSVDCKFVSVQNGSSGDNVVRNANIGIGVENYGRAPSDIWIDGCQVFNSNDPYKKHSSATNVSLGTNFINGVAFSGNSAL